LSETTWFLSLLRNTHYVTEPIFHLLYSILFQFLCCDIWQRHIEDRVVIQLSVNILKYKFYGTENSYTKTGANRIGRWFSYTG